MPPSLPQIHSAVPVICTADIHNSISYYTKVLGFSRDFEFGDPVVYAGVKSGDAEIYFTYDPNFVRLIKEKQIYPEVFIWLSDADSLYKVQWQMEQIYLNPFQTVPGVQGSMLSRK